MRPTPALAALALAACGRLGFRDAPIDAPADADPNDHRVIPAGYCLHKIAVPDAPVAELAATATVDGLAVVWSGDPAGLHGLTITPGVGRQPSALRTYDKITDARLSGLGEATAVIDLLTGDAGGVLSLHRLTHDLASHVDTVRVGAGLAGRDLLPAQFDRRRRVAASAAGNTIGGGFLTFAASAAAGDGTLGAVSSFTLPADARVLELACADGPTDHAHCAWSMTGAGVGPPQRCVGTDLKFDKPPNPAPPAPQGYADLPGNGLVGACAQLRITSSLPEHDAIIASWVRQPDVGVLDGPIEAALIGSIGNAHAKIAATGRAPQIRFDGSRTWIAWRDPAGSLRLASADFGLASDKNPDLSSTVTTLAFADWRPATDASFALITNYTRTAIVLLVLTRGELAVLDPC